MGNGITKESLSMPAKVVGMTCELCGGIALEKFVRTAVSSMHESVEYGGVPTRIGEIFLRAGAFDFGSRIAGKVFFDCFKVIHSGKEVVDAVVAGVKASAEKKEEEEETETETVEETLDTNEE